MTDRPYTDADLRAEAARQLATLAEDPDFMGIGERMEGHKIPSRGGFQWDQLADHDFDTAQRAIDDLLTEAADVSGWAITLGAAGLRPVTEHAVAVTTGGYAVAIQIATDPDLTDDARDELVAALRTAIDETTSRILGLKPTP